MQSPSSHRENQNTEEKNGSTALLLYFPVFENAEKLPDLSGSKMPWQPTQEIGLWVSAHQIYAQMGGISLEICMKRLQFLTLNHSYSVGYFRADGRIWSLGISPRAGQRWPVATILSPFSLLRLALRFPYNCHVGFWSIWMRGGSPNVKAPFPQMLPDLTVGIFFAFRKSQEKAVMIFFPPYLSVCIH